MKRRVAGRRNGVLVNRICAVLNLVLLVALAPPRLEAQSTLLGPLGANQTALSSCDDCNASVPITDVFPTGLNFGGVIYSELYISSNGYITFGHGNSGFSPLGIAAYTQGPIVAPQYDDLDPRKGGTIYFNQNTTSNYVVVTFEEVVAFSTPHSGSGANSFQVVLRRIGGMESQDFQIELRYVALNWARSGNNSAWPTAGWSAGNQTNFAELPQSGRADFRDIQSGTNVGASGVYRWDVEGGVVQSPPTVNQTTAVTDITGTTAHSGGNVSSDGGHPVTSRGLVFHTSPNPTTAHTTVTSGSGTGSFEVTMTELGVSTTYYVRAFATNTLGTAYGPERSFTTASLTIPSVSTTGASDVGTTTATSGGNVTSDGGANVTARGIALATTPNPTIGGNTISAGTGTGTFVSELADLIPGTTYHVRAYATNSEGTAYGGGVSFTTERLPQSISFEALEDLTYGSPEFDLEASATSSLDVSFESDNPEVAVITDATVSIVGAGTAVIMASQDGDALYAPAPDIAHTLEVLPKPVIGAFTVPAEKDYDDETLAEVTGRSLTGIEPWDVGEVALSGGTAHYDDHHLGTGKTVSLIGATLVGTRAAHYTLAEVSTTTAAIVPGPPDHVVLGGPESVTAGEWSASFTLVLHDAFSNVTRAEVDTRFNLVTDRAQGTAEFDPSDVALIPAGGQSTSFRYRNSQADGNPHLISATRATGHTLGGNPKALHALQVTAGTLHGFRVEGSDGGPIGESFADSLFHIRVTALDSHGNPVESFDGTADISSDGALVVGAGVTEAFENGVLAAHPVTFSEAGIYTLTASATVQGFEASGMSEPFEIIKLAPTLEVSVTTDSSTPALGDLLIIEVTIRNTGSASAHDVEIRDPLGDQDRLETQNVSVDRGAVDEGTGHWRVGTLEPDETAVMQIQAIVRHP